MSGDPDLAVLDELGVTVVARAMTISRESVRQWRRRGVIPAARRQELRQLANATPPPPGMAPAWPSGLAKATSNRARHA